MVTATNFNEWSKAFEWADLGFIYVSDLTLKIMQGPRVSMTIRSCSAPALPINFANSPSQASERSETCRYTIATIHHTVAVPASRQSH